MANEALYINNLPVNTTIVVPSGTTYYDRWELKYGDEAFPFFDDNDVLLWDASFTLRDTFLTTPGDMEPYLYSETITGVEDLLSGVFIEKETDLLGVVHTYYGLYLLAEDTAIVPSGRLWYTIKIKRISDDWTIRVQEGYCLVTKGS